MASRDGDGVQRPPEQRRRPGLVWAKISGRTLFVARTPIAPAENKPLPPPHLAPEWLDCLLEGAGRK
ncbi:MAG: hypothetical protein WC789_03540 [Lentisphaeria bacterium]